MRNITQRDLLQVVEGDSVVGPLENDLVLELNGVLLLVDVDKLHQDHRDVDRHGHDGVVCLAHGGDGGHPPIDIALDILSSLSGKGSIDFNTVNIQRTIGM